MIAASNEIDVDSKDTKDRCAEAKEECNIVRCPYGKEQYVDSQDCERCRCVDPCRTKICPEGTRCAITLVATQDGTEYNGVCQSSEYIVNNENKFNVYSAILTFLQNLLKLFLRAKKRNFSRNKIVFWKLYFFPEKRIKLLSHNLYGKIYVWK